jgi:hypothetical protein
MPASNDADRRPSLKRQRSADEGILDLPCSKYCRTIANEPSVWEVALPQFPIDQLRPQASVCKLWHAVIVEQIKFANAQELKKLQGSELKKLQGSMCAIHRQFKIVSSLGKHISKAELWLGKLLAPELVEQLSLHDTLKPWKELHTWPYQYVAELLDDVMLVPIADPDELCLTVRDEQLQVLSKCRAIAAAVAEDSLEKDATQAEFVMLYNILDDILKPLVAQDLFSVAFAVAAAFEKQFYKPFKCVNKVAHVLWPTLKNALESEGVLKSCSQEILEQTEGVKQSLLWDALYFLQDQILAANKGEAAFKALLSIPDGDVRLAAFHAYLRTSAPKVHQAANDHIDRFACWHTDAKSSLEHFLAEAEDSVAVRQQYVAVALRTLFNLAISTIDPKSQEPWPEKGRVCAMFSEIVAFMPADSKLFEQRKLLHRVSHDLYRAISRERLKEKPSGDPCTKIYTLIMALPDRSWQEALANALCKRFINSHFSPTRLYGSLQLAIDLSRQIDIGYSRHSLTEEFTKRLLHNNQALFLKLLLNPPQKFVEYTNLLAAWINEKGIYEFQRLLLGSHNGSFYTQEMRIADKKTVETVERWLAKKNRTAIPPLDFPSERDELTISYSSDSDSQEEFWRGVSHREPQ